MSEMTDREIIAACAKAMGLEIDYSMTGGGGSGNTGFDILGRAVLDWHEGVTYDPLHDDAQCFALVKRFKLSLFHTESGWSAGTGWGVEVETVTDLDCHYAICCAIARLHPPGGGG